MLKMASFLTEVPEWTQPPKPLQDGTDLIYYKSIVICLLGLFQETRPAAPVVESEGLISHSSTLNNVTCVRAWTDLEHFWR